MVRFGKFSIEQRWLVLAVLFLARFAFGFQFQSVSTVSPHLTEALSIDHGAIGLLIGLYMLPGIVIALPGGHFGDRFGDKPVVIAGLALMVIGGLLMGIGESYGVATAGRLLSGAGAVIANVLMTKMVADWFAGREIATAMAIFINAYPIGIGIALVTLPTVAHMFSWPAVFHATAAVGLVAWVVLAVTYRAPARSQPESPGDLGKLRLSRKELSLVCLAGGMWALYNGAYVIMLGFAPSFLMTTGIGGPAAGAIVSLNTWIAVASIGIGGVLADRFNRPNLIMAISCLGWAVCMLMVPLGSVPYLLFVLMGLFGGAAASSIVALPTEALQEQNRAVGIGIFYTWFYGGMALLPPFAGYVGDWLGGEGTPLVVAGLTMALALAPLAIFRAVQVPSPATLR